MKKIIYILFGFLLIASLAYFFYYLFRQDNKQPISITPTIKTVNFQSTAKEDQWLEYTHPVYKYSFFYPPEFSVLEASEKSSEILNQLRLFYQNRVTVLLIMVVNKPLEQAEIDYKNYSLKKILPLTKETSLVILGNEMSELTKNLQFSDTINKIITSLNV